MSQIDKNIKHTEPAVIPVSHKPMNTWKHMVAHVCIWFLVIVLVMVYFTSTGSPQAGLIEVGVSAMIFVILFHLVMKFFPLVSKIITSVITIGFGIALLFVNYHYLKIVKKDASLKQLLVGDLFVHKILITIKKEPIAIVRKEAIPETVSEQKHEKPSPTLPLEQLKTSIGEPITSGTNLELHVTPLEPVINAKTVFINEEYTVESYMDNTPNEISRLLFKECEPTIRHIMEKNDISHTILLGTIQDTPFAELKEQKIQPPVAGKAEAVPTK